MWFRLNPRSSRESLTITTTASMKRVTLQFGRTGLELDLPAANLTVVEPRFLPGLPDESAAFQEAVRKPFGRAPLKEIGNWSGP